MVRHEVVVGGGGVVGAALALALARKDFDVALVERGQGPRPYDPAHYDLRVYALAPASVVQLAALGVWGKIEQQRACAYQAMRVWDDRPEQALSFNAADLHAAQLGYIVENDLLLWALWGALGKVTIYRGVEVSSFATNGSAASLVLSDGRELSTKLVVAADGAESRLREMAGIETVSWAYPQKAVVCHAVTEKAHRNTAHQRFLPTGPLAFLPLADGRCSIVWSSQEAEELLALGDADFRARLAAALQFELGAILECTRRLSFPLHLLHARDYVRERLALAGDAAHVVHPLAGQGVNLGFADARALVQELAAARDAGRDIGSLRLLKRYERARKADNLDMLVITDGLYRAFGTRTPGWDGLRTLSMNAVNRLAPLKDFFVRRAIGS